MRRILIITQKVDRHDDVLGFFHRWLEELARSFSLVTVICLEQGVTSLPDNVRIFSLGKEKKRPARFIFSRLIRRLVYVINFYYYIFHERVNYDVVFVHMNQLYVLLGFWWWRRWHKTIGLWYAHGATPRTLIWAEKFADLIFTSTVSGFRLSSKKLKIVGQGIDTDRFHPLATGDRAHSFNIITVGRIAAVKNLHLLLAVAEILQRRGIDFTLKIAGRPILPQDDKYFSQLQEIVSEKGLLDRAQFVGAIPHQQIVGFYQAGDLFVNLSNTGSLDKAILEALSCGLPVLSSNEAIIRELGELCSLSLDPSVAAEKIITLINSPVQRSFRDYVIQNHSLKNLISKIANYYE